LPLILLSDRKRMAFGKVSVTISVNIAVGKGRYVRVPGVTRGKMSKSTAVDTVSGLDYEEIEEAVMETARGRWFLTEFARRQRASDTKILLDAIRRLEDQLLAIPATSSTLPSLGPMVAEAEDELQRLSGAGGKAHGSVNARDIATRLAVITSNLRDAARAPAETIAERLKPEIDKLQACAGAQDELAGKLSRAAQMVRRLRSSEPVDDQGRIAAPERQIASPVADKPAPAPAAAAVEASKPAMTAAVPEKAPSVPAFVPSDDDLFETGPAQATAHMPPQLPQARQISQSPARPPQAIGPDTLDFSAIEVPPLPDRVSSDDEDDDGAIAGKADAAAQVQEALEPEESREAELKARDRVIQVTRSSSARRQHDFGTPPMPPVNGRINMANPVAANQTATAAAAAPAGSSAANATDGKDKKRIIVIRRPADGSEGIPLAGDPHGGDGGSSGAA
jgi:hypothetical protein